MKCKTCGIEEVDGRKISVCDSCRQKEEADRVKKQTEERAEHQRVDQFVRKILSVSDIKQGLLNMQNLRQTIVKAVCWELLDRAANYEMLGEQSEAGISPEERVYTLHQVAKSANNFSDVRYSVEQLVEQVSNEMWHSLTKEEKA